MKTYIKPVVKTTMIQTVQLIAVSFKDGEADPGKPALGGGFRGLNGFGDPFANPPSGFGSPFSGEE